MIFNVNLVVFFFNQFSWYTHKPSSSSLKTLEPSHENIDEKGTKRIAQYFVFDDNFILSTRYE